jgi:hypothetical protein
VTAELTRELRRPEILDNHDYPGLSRDKIQAMSSGQSRPGLSPFLRNCLGSANAKGAVPKVP